MLEAQQSQLVFALRDMYKRLQEAQAWPGPKLEETNGFPLTHDILAALGLLTAKREGNEDVEMFEEDCSKLQSRLLLDGNDLDQRSRTFGSDSDLTQYHERPSGFSHGTPLVSHHLQRLRESSDFGQPSTPPMCNSPIQSAQPAFPQMADTSLQQASPLMNTDTQFYQADWSFPDRSTFDMVARSTLVPQSYHLQDMIADPKAAIGASNSFDYFMTWPGHFNELSMNDMPQMCDDIIA